MWFRVLSFLIAAVLVLKAAVALAIPERFYAGRRRQYAAESMPGELLVPPAIILSVTAVSWYAALSHYRPWGWIVTGALTVLASLSLHNLTRWRSHRATMSRIVSSPNVSRVDYALLVVGAGFAALGWFVF
jgi:hypothetical protein